MKYFCGGNAICTATTLNGKRRSDLWRYDELGAALQLGA